MKSARERPLTAKRLEALRVWAKCAGGAPGFEIADGATNQALEDRGFLEHIGGSNFKITKKGEREVRFRRFLIRRR